MELIPVQKRFFDKLFDFETTNREWFEEWVPPRPHDYFIYERFVEYCERLIEEVDSGEGLYFIGLIKGEVIGRFNLTFLESGAVDIGYRVAYKHIGKGYAYTFSKMLVEEARKVGGKRLQADALVENTASTKVLKKLGFELTSNETKAIRLGTKTFKLAPYHLLLTKQ
ncbi:GNAT family N-acetyltransferase [Gynuella sunshinyii]|uniref:Acetyltransferase, including N-acetylase of ribosomal protein n=1 Tax=Gynuella sunshinyii YC6258 TaxID=1445510 RepID=A0A0C5V1G8_9GAMM|nr:GNAT family N-acetyltransferase [Gynuella sunshinyii]AJQ93380.1 acetyltransferase, including N-acetylase of ribosomal protein [Gynuella sunshinyii YC6258]